MIQLQLSPETPLARDGARATRSVAHARTTHHLATGLHQDKGYFPGHPLVKQEKPTIIGCNAFKKVINDNQEFLWLRGLRGRPDQRGGFDGVQLGPALIEIRLALSGDQVLEVRRSAGVLVIHHFNDIQAFGIDHSERSETLLVEAGIILQVDEELSGAGAWSGSRKGQIPSLVALRHGIILQVRVSPSD